MPWRDSKKRYRSDNLRCIEGKKKKEKGKNKGKPASERTDR